MRGPLSKLVDDVRRYQALHWKAIDLLNSLGHKRDERGFEERLASTLKALDR